MLNKSRPVYKLNLKKQLKNKKEELIKDILNSKHKDTGSGYNFRVCGIVIQKRRTLIALFIYKPSRIMELNLNSINKLGMLNLKILTC